MKTTNTVNKLLAKAVITVAGVAAIIAPFSNHVEAAKSFKDVPKTHWANASISQASDRGLVSGYTDGTFRPKGDVTRAEFAAFLARTFDGTERMAEPFTDISDSYWAKDNIEEGIALGFIQPKDYNDKFEPNKAMTRGEMAKWLTNGLTASNSEYGVIADTIQKSSYTLLPISEFYKGGVSKADYGNIAVMLGTDLMSGYADGSFKPNGKTTRAEVSTILIRFLNAKAKAPSNFTKLNELKEVAETGTNMTSISRYKYAAYLNGATFENVVNKPITYGKYGEMRVKHFIFVPIDNYEQAMTSVFGKMFISKGQSFQNKDLMSVYIDQTFLPNQSKIDILAFKQASKSLFLGQGRVYDKQAVKNFGYNTLPAEQYLFQKNKAFTYWSETATEYGNDRFSGGFSAGLNNEYKFYFYLPKN